jgi:hypothetical protein
VAVLAAAVVVALAQAQVVALMMTSVSLNGRSSRK